MNRRQSLALPLTFSSALAAGACTTTPAPSDRTQWDIRLSEGFDALAFLGPLSGKTFYARYYEADIAAFKPRVPKAALDALARLVVDADAADTLLWPWLALLFSGAAATTLADLVGSLETAERSLLPPFRASTHWDARDWDRFVAARPDIERVLRGLQDAGFAAYRAGRLDAAVTQRREALRALYARLDIIGEQERLLGRRIDPRIEINLLLFCRPHGVRVQRQRFLAHVQSSDAVMVLTAAHELLHPPFDMAGGAARACLTVLARDGLFARILAEKSRDTGYNTLAGILEEDTIQALDQIIQERLGYGRPPAVRWGESDEGMHVLAAALYGLLKADGFDRTGGDIAAWMQAAAASGKLAPPTLHRAAAAVLGRPPQALWSTPSK